MGREGGEGVRREEGGKGEEGTRRTHTPFLLIPCVQTLHSDLDVHKKDRIFLIGARVWMMKN